MITINTFRASNISVGVMHLGFPFLAICILTTTNTTLRLFNSDIEAIYLDMTLLVVASFFLCFSRIGINLCFLFFTCTLSFILFRYTFSLCKQIFTDSIFFSSFFRFFLLCIRLFAIFANRRSVLRSYYRALCLALGFIRVNIVQTLLLSRRSSRIFRSAPNNTTLHQEP